MWPPLPNHNRQSATGWLHSRVGGVLQPRLECWAAQVKNLRYALARPKQLQRTVRQDCLTRSLSVAVLATVLLICGCQVPRSADRLRTDFLALRYLQMAEAALADKPADFDEAVHSLNRALALAPDHQLVLARAGTLYTAAEAYQQAIPMLRKAQGITGHSYYYELGTCYLRTGDQQRGTVYLEEVLSYV